MKHHCMLSRDALAAGHRACLDRYGHDDARTVEFFEALTALDGASDPPSWGAQGRELSEVQRTAARHGSPTQSDF
jgi:hypothetical protein